MKNIIFINKYIKIKDEISKCIPEDSMFIHLDSSSVLVKLSPAFKRKEVISCCRNALGQKKETLIQPVNDFVEKSDTIELTIPNMKRFFNKT